MANATWSQTNFNGGEMSPTMRGRIDIQQYKKSGAFMLNFAPNVQGEMMRRPGFQFITMAICDNIRLIPFRASQRRSYVLELGDHTLRVFDKSGAQVDVNADPNGTATEIPYTTSNFVTTPYGAAKTADAPEGEINQVQFTQVNDVMFLTHPKYPPQMLTVSGPGTQYKVGWDMNPIPVIGGPWADINATTTTGVLSAPIKLGGANTLTFSGSDAPTLQPGDQIRIYQNGVWLTVQVNSGTGPYAVTVLNFPGAPDPYDAVLRPVISDGYIRSVDVLDGGAGYLSTPTVQITDPGGGTGAVIDVQVSDGVVTAAEPASGVGTGYSAATTLTVVRAPAQIGTPTTLWRVPAWGPTRGYPSSVVVFQQRLVFAGQPSNPSEVFASQTGRFYNFTPTHTDGTVTDDMAFSFTVAGGMADTVQWLMADEWGLLVGTEGAEYVISPSALQQALTPTNINVKLSTAYGSEAIQPVRVGKSTLFIQRTGTKLREMTYQYVLNTFQAPDISLVADTWMSGGFDINPGDPVLRIGVKSLSFASAPTQALYMTLRSGYLMHVTYDKDQEVCGYSRFQLGGSGNSQGTYFPSAITCTVIPNNDLTRDQLWAGVTRYVKRGGSPITTIERMAPWWDTGSNRATDCCYVDCAVCLTSDTATKDWTLPADWPGYADDLNMLYGNIDGAATNVTLVSPGKVKTKDAGRVLWLGYIYPSVYVTNPIESGGAEGAIQGKPMNIRYVHIRVRDAGGLQYSDRAWAIRDFLTGADVGQEFGLKEIDLRDLAPFDVRQNQPPADPERPTNPRRTRTYQDMAIPLYSGIVRVTWDGTWDRDQYIALGAYNTLPVTVQFISAELQTQEGR